MISVLKRNEWGQMRLGKPEKRNPKSEKRKAKSEKRKERVHTEDTEEEHPSPNTLRINTEKKAATPRGERASILGKAEPRPVGDEVDCPAAALDS